MRSPRSRPIRRGYRRRLRGLAAASTPVGCLRRSSGLAGGETCADPFATRRGRSRSGSVPRKQRTASPSASSRTRAARIGSRGTSSRPPAQPGRLPAVLHLHGAGGDRDEQLDVARRLARRGAMALTITAPSQAKEPPSGLAPEAALRWQRDETVEDLVAARRALDLLAADERVDRRPPRARRVEHGRPAGGDGRGGRRPRPGDGAHVDRRVARLGVRRRGARGLPRRRRGRAPRDRPARLRGRDRGRRARPGGRVGLDRAAAGAPERRRRSTGRSAKVEWYRTDHALDEAATRNRLDWLAGQLGLSVSARAAA